MPGWSVRGLGEAHFSPRAAMKLAPLFSLYAILSLLSVTMVPIAGEYVDAGCESPLQEDAVPASSESHTPSGAPSGYYLPQSLLETTKDLQYWFDEGVKQSVVRMEQRDAFLKLITDCDSGQGNNSACPLPLRISTLLFLADMYITSSTSFASVDYSFAKAIWMYLAADETGNIEKDVREKLRLRFIEVGALEHAKKVEETTMAREHVKRGSEYHDMKQWREGLKEFEQAHSLSPHIAYATYNWAYFRKMLAVWDRKSPERRREDGHMKQRKAVDTGRSNSEDGYLEMLTTLERTFWTNQLEGREIAVLHPFIAMYFPINPLITLKAAQNFAYGLEKLVHTQHALSSLQYDHIAEQHRRSAPLSRRVRVGFVSADFSQKATTYLAAYHFPLFDKTKMEVFVFAVAGDENSRYRRVVREGVEHFIDLSPLKADPARAVELVRQCELDILVNMDGYSNEGVRFDFINALRHAPIQITWFVYIGTLGSPHYDYIVTDPVATPQSYDKYFTERFLYLPGSFFPNNMAYHFPLPGLHSVGLDSSSSSPFSGDTELRSRMRVANGLPADLEKTVFICFNKIMKIDMFLFDVWARILRQVPDSVLWLLESPADAVEGVQQYAQLLGVKERVVFAPFVNTAEENFERYALADIALDTTVWGSHTTAVDALWAGVPLVTCIDNCMGDELDIQGNSETMGGRVAASILTALEMPELIAHSLDEYMLKAVRLASHPEEYRKIRHKLLDARETSPYFQTDAYVKKFQSALVELWGHYLENGNTDDHIYTTLD